MLNERVLKVIRSIAKNAMRGKRGRNRRLAYLRGYSRARYIAFAIRGGR